MGAGVQGVGRAVAQAITKGRGGNNSKSDSASATPTTGEVFKGILAALIIPIARIQEDLSRYINDTLSLTSKETNRNFSNEKTIVSFGFRFIFVY